MYVWVQFFVIESLLLLQLLNSHVHIDKKGEVDQTVLSLSLSITHKSCSIYLKTTY